MPPFSHEFIKELITYYPETGEMKWNPRKPGKFFTEEEANSFKKAGQVIPSWRQRQGGSLYSRFPIPFTSDKGVYQQKKFIWYYMTGEWSSRQITQKDGDVFNLRWSNLSLQGDYIKCQINTVIPPKSLFETYISKGDWLTRPLLN